MKYQYLVLIALVTLVCCNSAGDAEHSGEEAENKTLEACGCVSAATSMIEGMESAEDLESLDEKLEEAHPECADIDEKEVDENCQEEMAEMVSKAMELSGM